MKVDERYMVGSRVPRDRGDGAADGGHAAAGGGHAGRVTLPAKEEKKVKKPVIEEAF